MTCDKTTGTWCCMYGKGQYNADSAISSARIRCGQNSASIIATVAAKRHASVQFFQMCILAANRNCFHLGGSSFRKKSSMNHAPLPHCATTAGHVEGFPILQHMPCTIRRNLLVSAPKPHFLFFLSILCQGLPKVKMHLVATFWESI